MDYETWIAALTTLLRKRLADLEVFPRTHGVCFVAGQSSLDVVDARNGHAMIVPLKDPLRMIDGRMSSRHHGITLPRLAVRLADETLMPAVDTIVAHLRPSKPSA